jgi:hypothetical protein
MLAAGAEEFVPTLSQSIPYDRLRWGQMHSEQAIVTRI